MRSSDRYLWYIFQTDFLKAIRQMASMPEILQKITRSQVPAFCWPFASRVLCRSTLQMRPWTARLPSETIQKKSPSFFTAFFLYQTFSVIFPQLFCTVCAISAVISNFPHVFTDNIYLLNMTKKETPRIFLYRISPQISSQKYTWVSFFKICQVRLSDRSVDKSRAARTTPSRNLHSPIMLFPYYIAAHIFCQLICRKNNLFIPEAREFPPW